MVPAVASFVLPLLAPVQSSRSSERKKRPRSNTSSRTFRCGRLPLPRTIARALLETAHQPQKIEGRNRRMSITQFTRFKSDVERVALIPQVKLNLHLRRDPHNSNSELFLLGGFSRANHDFPSIVHSIEQHSHFRRPGSKQRGAFPD